MKKTNLKGAKKITKKKVKTTPRVAKRRASLVQSRRAKKYPVHYLAVILALALILEGVLFGITTGPDWREAVQLIDVSNGVTEVSHNLSVTLQPIADVFSDVNQFYQLAATEMIKILDLSDSSMGSELGAVYDGVETFYQQASVQMADVLDISSATPWSGQISGISIEK
jgi:hypothetical protein